MAGVRIARAALVAALAFALTGCGTEEKAASGGGARIVPASAPVFVSIDSDLSSNQWQTVDDLLHEFPGRPQLLTAIRSTLRDEGLDYERDVEPAFGKEIDVVWLDFASGGENVVGLTQPKDETALRRLVEKGNREDPDNALVLGEVEGWTVLADSQAKIDRFRAAVANGAKLADDETFTDAIGELPEDALVKAYAKGENLTTLFQRALQEFQGTGTGTYDLRVPAESRPEFISAALAAEGDGLRLAGATRAETEPKTKATVFESTLIDEVPWDAIAFLTFRGNDAFVKQARSSPTYKRSLGELQKMLGLPVDKLFELFAGEVALYVRPGTPFPEVTLLIPVASDEPAEEAAFQRVDQLLKAITRLTPAQPCHAPTVEDGVTVACVDFGKVEVRYAGFDEKVVVTTGQSPVAELRSDGTKLADAEAFEDAKAAADLPDETAGFLWIDVAKAVPMLVGLAQAGDAEIPAEVRANLAPLKSLVLWADAEGRTYSFSAFVGID
jgi:Protein of unknown function (DUF3352)